MTEHFGEPNSFARYKGGFKGLGGDLNAIKRGVADLRDDEDQGSH